MGNYPRWLELAVCCVLLSACGGGGDATPTVATTSVTKVDMPAVAAPTTVAGAPPPRPLETPAAALANSLACSSGVEGATRPVVLLVHGTALNATNTFSWNWVPALTRLALPYCTVNLPFDGMGDIQIAAEYVVYALRTIAQRSGQKVQVVGHSQGGMVPRWALRFWPDTRALVDDLVSLSGSNHGTVLAGPLCLPTCSPAIWQQRSNAAFLAVLNREMETYPEISYTSIYTHIDEVVFPNLGRNASSRLRGGSTNVVNVATQEICPLNLADHLLIGTSDAVAHALALDAIQNTGPAQPARVPRSVCSQLFMPGVDPLDFPVKFLELTAGIAGQLLLAPKVGKEPPLKCYATGAC